MRKQYRLVRHDGGVGLHQIVSDDNGNPVMRTDRALLVGDNENDILELLADIQNEIRVETPIEEKDFIYIPEDKVTDDELDFFSTLNDGQVFLKDDCTY